MGITTDRKDPRLSRGPQDEKPVPVLCSVEGCQEDAFARSWCRMHYARRYRAWKSRGDIEFAPKEPRGCLITECTRAHKGHGLCQFHLKRKQKGLPMLGLLRKPSHKRYLTVVRKEHPLAYKNGRLFVHRMVLYDSVGGGRLPCFWCGRPLFWNKNRFASGALYVDHADHNRHNNAPTNLLPACNPCNAGRMRPNQRMSMYTSA